MTNTEITLKSLIANLTLLRTTLQEDRRSLDDLMATIIEKLGQFLGPEEEPPEPNLDFEPKGKGVLHQPAPATLPRAIPLKSKAQTWASTGGTFSDEVVSIIKESKQPMHIDDIVRARDEDPTDKRPGTPYYAVKSAVYRLAKNGRLNQVGPGTFTIGRGAT